MKAGEGVCHDPLRLEPAHRPLTRCAAAIGRLGNGSGGIVP
jgi:hypothetical protein